MATGQLQCKEDERERQIYLRLARESVVMSESPEETSSVATVVDS